MNDEQIKRWAGKEGRPQMSMTHSRLDEVQRVSALEKLEKITLKYGNHDDYEQGMCAMEAVAYIAGESKITDHPKCACPVITAIMIRRNDRMDDNAARTALLRDLVPYIVGTRSTEAVEPIYRITDKGRGVAKELGHG